MKRGAVKGSAVEKPAARVAAPALALPRESIAIIVIGRNVSPFIGECLRSVQAQTMRPDELLFVDDGSTDDSATIAEGLGVNVLRLTDVATPVGMCEARMCGMRATVSTLILFVDGDDVLPATYLADLYAAMGGRDLAYPGEFRFIGDPERCRQRSGRSDGIRPLPEARRSDLWRQNHVSTCSLWRRAAIMQAGGWIESPSRTMGDWHLALRVTALGGGYARSKARLDYRLHGENWTLQERPGTPAERCGWLRKDVASITIGCVYSGRLPSLWLAWIGAVVQTLDQAGKRAELIILDDSAEGHPGYAVNDTITGVTIRRIHRGETTATRRGNAADTCNFLAAQCNDLLRSARGDVLWIIEDDIIVPANACADLLQQLLAVGDAPRPAVCGAYLNRWHDGNYVLTNVEPGNRCVRWTSLPSGPTPVQLTGTGCLMLLRDLLPRGLQFRAELPLSDTVRKHSHDWSLTYRLHLLGKPVIVVPSVVCRHHHSLEDWM